MIPGRYPERPASYLLANDGQGNFSKLGSSEVDQLGMVTDAIKADLDGDQGADRSWRVDAFENFHHQRSGADKCDR